MGKGGFKGKVPDEERMIRVMQAQRQLDEMYERLQAIYNRLRSIRVPVNDVRDRIRNLATRTMTKILTVQDLNPENVTTRNVNALVDEFVAEEERRRLEEREQAITYARNIIMSLLSELRGTYRNRGGDLERTLNATNFEGRVGRTLWVHELTLNDVFPGASIRNSRNLAYRFLNLR